MTFHKNFDSLPENIQMSIPRQVKSVFTSLVKVKQLLPYPTNILNWHLQMLLVESILMEVALRSINNTDIQIMFNNITTLDNVNWNTKQPTRIFNAPWYWKLLASDSVGSFG